MDTDSLVSSEETSHAGSLPGWPTVALALVALLAFIAATPSGLLTKADMVGYAVCHQIGSHSFSIAGHQLPLCARCTGTFLGALTGLLGQVFVLRRRKAAAFPPAPLLVLMVGFMALWASDGLNSYLAMVGGPHLYEPRNWLRLVTGSLNGLAMSALIYPIVNITLWREPREKPAIRHLRDLILLVLMEAGLVGLVLSRWTILLYPLALLSALGVLSLLTGVNSVLMAVLLDRENRAETWRDMIVPLLAGLTVSLVQIGLIDLLRYTLTGTLEGIPLS
jgi:uncharacterized membrane protein